MTHVRESTPAFSAVHVSHTTCLVQTRPAVGVKLLTSGDTELGALGTDISQTFYGLTSSGLKDTHTSSYSTDLARAP